MSIPLDSSELSQRLVDLGLDEDEADVYLLLLSRGRATPLALSRTSGHARSTLYRVLDRLVAKDLVSPTDGSFEARPPTALEGLLADRQNDLDSQRAMLPSVMGALAGISSHSAFGSRIVYYSGVSGLRQVTLNSLEAKGNLAIFELDDMSAFLERDFAESVRRQMTERHISVRQITNSRHLTDWTEETDFVTNAWSCRHVSAKQMPIVFETLIYDDVFAAYTYENDEIFSVEIRNAALATMQLRLFDFVWQRATPMRVTSPGGAAEVMR